MRKTVEEDPQFTSKTSAGCRNCQIAERIVLEHPKLLVLTTTVPWHALPKALLGSDSAPEETK